MIKFLWLALIIRYKWQWRIKNYYYSFNILCVCVLILRRRDRHEMYKLSLLVDSRLTMQSVMSSLFAFSMEWHGMLHNPHTTQKTRSKRINRLNLKWHLMGMRYEVDGFMLDF